MTFPEFGIDCKVEDSKTYYSKRGEKYRETEKISKTAKYYVVCLTDQRKLMNGFKYIKELFLQCHNFSTHETFEKLKANSIKVYAVKTDAFHIAKKDVRMEKKLLGFRNDIGGWRVESNKFYELESGYNWKFNELAKISTLRMKQYQLNMSGMLKASVIRLLQKEEL